MNTTRWTRGLALATLFATAAFAAQAAEANPLADSVRQANDRFRDVAAATAEGYAPIACASGVDGGGMGIHYVNAAYLGDDAVDLSKPEAVMYEPKGDGSLELIAVEYITLKGAGGAAGSPVRLHQHAQPLRPAAVLRAACLGLEAQPARRLRRHEPGCVM